MIKFRDAGYCNLKLLLIICVVYGHWIEPFVREEPMLLAQYRMIYLFHMPLFAWLSGLFLKSGGACIRTVKRTLPVYLICQTAAVLLGNGQVRWHTPWWHLWYLLSTVCWAGAAWLWFRFGKGRGGWLILVLSLAAGCLAGEARWLSRVMSGSRTVVFFPYFWLGVLTPGDISREKLRVPSLAVLGAMGGVMAWVWENAGTVFLYQAAPFGSVENGPLLRLGCYGTGFALGMMVLAWLPGRRFRFTRMGADTMAVYLLHGVIVGWLRRYELPVWGYLPAALGLIGVIDGLFRWHGCLYGVVETERRRRLWRPWKRSMRNTEKWSINSWSA